MLLKKVWEKIFFRKFRFFLININILCIVKITAKLQCKSDIFKSSKKSIFHNSFINFFINFSVYIKALKLCQLNVIKKINKNYKRSSWKVSKFF